MSDVDFASLLCSRLCHDLVSPVGALANGIEILADETDPDMRAQCLQLLADSAQQTANRLKFFRLAFGAGGGFSEQVDVREAQAAIQGMFAADKVKLDWLVTLPALPKVAVKVLLNLSLIAGDALLRGGALRIAAERAEDQVELVVRAECPRLLHGEVLRLTMTGDTASFEATPRVAPALLVRQLLGHSGATLRLLEPEPGVLVFGAQLAA